TPETRETPEPAPGERPYVGWLGLGFSIHARDTQTLNSVEISIGTVGPHAFAEESQDAIHDIRNLDKFNGWDSQMPNEPTLNIVLNQKRRWNLLEDAQLPWDLEIDGFHEAGVSLGNFLTDIHVGGLVRIGWNLPVEFSDTRLTPTAHTQRLFSNGDSNEDRWSYYAIFGARGSAILHDITLDGPVFRDYETGINKEPLVGEAYLGFGVRRGNWEFSYVHTYRSKQFQSQDDPQGFGSMAIRKRF
ncbi:MAG: lipid A deacylase LpxR family protein, partial [Akkermansiaceae bacterium]